MKEAIHLIVYCKKFKLIIGHDVWLLEKGGETWQLIHHEPLDMVEAMFKFEDQIRRDD